MVLEGVQEFSENLVFSLLTGLYIWVLFGVVSLSDIVDVELTRLVRVHNFVCLHGDSLSEGVHLSTDNSQELIIGNLTTSISIEDGEALGNLGITHTDSEIMHGLLEFFLIELSTSVIVSDLEFLSNTADTSSTTFGDFCSEVVQ